MNPRLANIIFTFFALCSVPATLFPFYETSIVLDKIREKSEVIPYNTGSYYLTLMSVFWPLIFIIIADKLSQPENKKAPHLINRLAISAKEKLFSVIVGWFLVCLVLANLAPFIVKKTLEINDYNPCRDPEEISSFSRGRSFIYIMHGDCSSIANKP